MLLNVEANETWLRKSPLQDYRYLHFATHADLPGKVQGIKEPFILLGQVENQTGDDGFLTLSEVLGLKLQAQMVVLSACVTGRGQVMEGEGVANFARAFQYAGARSVVVSLWEVASKVAVEFMKIFYGHLKGGQRPGQGPAPGPPGNQGQIPQPLLLGGVHFAWGGVSLGLRSGCFEKFLWGKGPGVTAPCPLPQTP